MQDNTISSSHQETKPLVTFIITYHEQPAAMLAKCIESITALSMRPFEREIIVVDDGSANSPLAELKRYENDVIYLRKPNGGVSTARNFGLQVASGTFIQFVDADDMLLTSTYEHCIDVVRYGNADVVLFDFSQSATTVMTYEDGEPTSGSDLMRSRNIHGSAWSYLFRRTILGNLTFTPGIDYGEDEEFTPQLLLRAEHVVSTTAKAYYYRQHEASATGNNGRESIMRRLADNHTVILRLNTVADTLPMAERMALSRRVAQLTMDYIYNTIVLTRSRELLDQHLEQLRAEGLFPLPDRHYTTKYTWFRRMTNSSLGLSVLMRTLPLLKQER